MSGAGLRVLARPAFANRRVNPYNYLLYRALGERGVQVDEYYPHRALGRYDLLHVHWPESTFNASLPEALVTTRSLLLSIDWMRARGTKLIWTAHNLCAHERRFPAAERRFFVEFSARVDAFVALGEASRVLVRERFPRLRDTPGFVIPHHHYAGEYPSTLDREAARGELGLEPEARVLLFLGRVARYKGVASLIETVRRIAEDAKRPLRLVIAGAPKGAGIERELRSAAGADPRIRFHFALIEPAAVGAFMAASDLVVLPYREILNSGSAMLAASFDRPVLLPRSPAFHELERRLGQRFVLGYDRLEPELVLHALEHAIGLRGSSNRERLHELSPELAAERTLTAYRALLGAEAGLLERSA